ncbi:MAG: segregation and condensation protein A [Phycisphaeraceae bacterium]
MSDYRVQLEAYAGPLDLLLYLVKRHEIDLHDIPMAELTEQYLSHLEVIKAIDLENAGEFLVMAATLLEIKSQMLMPREQAEGEGEPEAAADAGFDPRYELVQQLLAYKRYKDAAGELEKRQAQWEQRVPAHPVARPKHRPAGEDEDAEPKEIELEDVSLLDLCEAFARILDSIGQSRQHEVTYDDTPISLHAEDIYDRLQRDGRMTLRKIFEGRGNRSEMIGLFLATLELVRDRKVKVIQEEIAGEVSLEPAPPGDADALADDEAADWRDPETGEMQYDWPDEEGRRLAERRQRMRERRAEETEADGADADEDLPDASADEAWDGDDGNLMERDDS